jgi:hypothetical protein
MHLLCNAYWLDTDALQGCDLPKIKETTYGFNQNADVVATLPPSPLDNFCASAKHNSSPNTYSIDSASLISSGENCGGAGGASDPGQSSVTKTIYRICDRMRYSSPCFDMNSPLTQEQIKKGRYYHEGTARHRTCSSQAQCRALFGS